MAVLPASVQLMGNHKISLELINFFPLSFGVFMHNIFYYKNISNLKLFLFFYCEQNSLVFFHKEEELCVF